MGPAPSDGRRLLLRRPVGFDLHSVRDYQQGESLRRVHWPSTARRGALMVKELEDSPRDEVAVLLDGDPAGVTGSPPDSSFDVAVRAAGSILRAQVRSGRRACSSSTLRGREEQIVSSDGQEWLRALELLAAAEADARGPAAALLRSADGPAARSLELVVVTSRIERSLVDRLLERTLTRRPVALVHIEAAKLRGTPTTAADPSSCACRRQECRSPCCDRGTTSPSRCTAPARRRWLVRSATRTIAASAPALAVVAVAWLRLEQPVGSLWPVLALLALALAAAVPTRHWLRAIGAVAATVLAARVAVGVDLVPWRLNQPSSGFGLADSFSTLGTRFGNGFSDFYGTHLPFDPRVHVAMHELVLSGLFLFALGVALLAAARRSVASALLLLVGAGWPATLLGPSRGIAMGAAILGGALVLLGGLGSRRVPALAIPAAVVVGVAAIAVGSATAARHGLVNWQSWNLAHLAIGPSDVGFVWNAQYGGLKFSGHPTNVLQVVSDRPPTYLRATVLDDFRDDAWAIGPPRPADSLEPVAAHRPRNQTRESVTVTALADTHLVGGSIPMRFEAADGAPLVRLEPGFAALTQNLPQGFRYTVWSYAAHPTPAALRRSPPDYPAELEEQGLLTVGENLTALPFGFSEPPHRDARAPDSPRPLRVCAARASRGAARRRRPDVRMTRSRSSSNGSSPPARSTTRTTHP